MANVGVGGFPARDVMLDLESKELVRYIIDDALKYKRESATGVSKALPWTGKAVEVGTGRGCLMCTGCQSGASYSFHGMR